MRKGIRSWLVYVLLFVIWIVYWECMMQLAEFGSLQQMQPGFLCFVLPQAMVPAALCGWSKKRPGRISPTLLTLLLGVFYCAQLLYYRIFGSVITLSMLGVGGDALESFGWALMVTVRESLGWIALFALPVLVMLARLFFRRTITGRLPLAVRGAAIAAAVVLWLLGGAALRLGGTSEASAWQAYTSSLVDTDTAAQRLGVLTTSTLEAGTMLFGSGEEAETAEAIDEFAAIELPRASARPTPPPEESRAADEKDENAPGTEAEDENAPGTESEAPGTEAPAETRGEDRSPNVREEIDFGALAEKTKDPNIRKLCEYFAALPGTNRNAYTGLLKDYNVVFVCGESFSNISVSEQLTPTLWRMAHEGIVLTNYYNSFKNTTTNGEFAMLTGLWPDVSRKADVGQTNGSFSQSATHFMPFGLGNLLRGEGYESYMFHNYVGSYYGRNKSHANLGYTCRFSDTMELRYTWPASDREMFEQTVDDYIGAEHFNVYYMTFSGHGPYNIYNNPLVHHNYSQVPEVVDGRKMSVLGRCFFASDLELEWSMEYLLERLEEAGKLDNTLVVVTGDHYPYYLSDATAVSILGKSPERNFERFHSTCIMWCGGLDEPIVCDEPCCNVDILPTVLNLLGVEFDSRLLPGTDVFSDAPHTAVLSNKSFITDVLKYNALSGQSFKLAPELFPDKPSLRSYIDSVNSDIKARYAASLAVNKTDFYRFVWENSGLADEIPAAPAPVITASPKPDATPGPEASPEPEVSPELEITPEPEISPESEGSPAP